MDRLALIQRISNIRNLPTKGLRNLGDVGIANEIWAVPGSHVIRFPRFDDVAQGLRAECIAALNAFENGVPTPELILFDDSRSLGDDVYSIFAWADGVVLGNSAIDDAIARRVYQDLGRHIAVMHRCPIPEGPDGERLELSLADPYEAMAEEGFAASFPAAERHYIERWVAHLQPVAVVMQHAFVHSDLHSWNVLIDPDAAEVTAILDWGHAGCGDPVTDFAGFPLRWIPTALEAYVDAGGDLAGPWPGRLLYDWLASAIWESSEPSFARFPRDWWRWPKGGLGETVELVRDFGWAEWLPSA